MVEESYIAPELRVVVKIKNHGVDGRSGWCGVSRVFKFRFEKASDKASPADPLVMRDIRATRPVTVDGSRILVRPSISSSPGSVAELDDK